MLVDKRGKLFGRVSLIDIGLIVIILLCLAGAWVRFAGLIGDTATTGVDIEYTIQIKSIREPSVEALLKKGKVYAKSASEEYMGEIVDAVAEPNDDYSQLVDGTLVKTSAPERYDVTLTIRTTGRQSESALYTDSNKRIEAGSLEYITTKWVSAEGEIKSVKMLEQ